MKPLISISIPVFNEEANIPALYQRLAAVAERMKDRCDLEFVFSDNNSTDNTWMMLDALSVTDPRVRAIRFSKNFGFQRSILANYIHTRGDAVMQIDADLQDPPEMLEQFFDYWQAGYHVVFGIRAERQEGVLITRVRKWGYAAIDKLSEHPVSRNAGDFRLMDRKVVDALQKYRSPDPYLRGIIAGMGFRQRGVAYARSARVAGESKFGFMRVVSLGITGVLNHSTVPLRIATIAGLAILFLSTVGAVYYILMRMLHPEWPRGIASVLILVLFGIGFQALLLGILGEYLLRIYKLLRNEPVAIVEESLNFSPDELKL